jgi:hypothetical protein
MQQKLCIQKVTTQDYEALEIIILKILKAETPNRNQEERGRQRTKQGNRKKQDGDAQYTKNTDTYDIT